MYVWLDICLNHSTGCILILKQMYCLLDPNERHSEYGAQWQRSTKLICQCFLSSVGEEGTVGAYVLPSQILHGRKLICGHYKHNIAKNWFGIRVPLLKIPGNVSYCHYGSSCHYSQDRDGWLVWLTKQEITIFLKNPIQIMLSEIQGVAEVQVGSEAGKLKDLITSQL